MEPELSVVIPTHGRPGRLRACLDSLAAQTHPPDSFEVIVVVDGDDPAIEEMLSSSKPPFPLRVIVQDHAGQAAARNRGVEEARGRYVLFLDDDVVTEPRLVAAHLDTLRADDRVACIGRIDKLLPRRAPRWARARQTTFRGHYDRLAAGRKPRFTDCYAGNLSLARSSFGSVGGFALDLIPEEDIEFGYRLERAGLTFVYVPEAVAREQDRDTLRRVVADGRRRGVVGAKLYERHPELLPHLRLGGRGEQGRYWIALRRLLLFLRIPPLLVGVAVRLAPSEAFARQWFAFLRRYCYWWGVRESVDRSTWRRLQRGAAILMHHAIGHERERPSRYVLRGSRFKRQLAWLKLRGYNVISLDEFVRAQIEHRLPPPKSVVLTFDDGYADNVELALPVLERYGFPATVFLVSAADRVDWDRAGQTEGRALLNPAEAKALNGRLAFGAHSRTHPTLTKLEPSELEREVSGSRLELETALEVPVMHFAYPYGATNPEVKQAVMKAGYLAACGITPGRNRPAADRYSLHRLEVRGTDSLVRFALTLWLGDTQALPRWRRSR